MRFPLSKFFVLSSAMLAGLLTPQAQAKTFVVNNTDDTFDDACNANCSLRDAMREARVTAGSHIIRFAPSVFNRPQTIKLTAGGGFILERANITIEGPANAPLTLDSDDRSRHFTCLSSDLKISNLILTHGSGNFSANLHNYMGGSIVAQRGSVSLDRCVLSENRAVNGGAICNLGARLEMTNCTVVGNTASGLNLTGLRTTPSAGAIVNSGVNSLDGSAVLTHCTIVGNKILLNDDQTSGTGGIENYTVLQLSNTLMANNVAVHRSGTALNLFDVKGRVSSQGFNLIRTPGTLASGGSEGYVGTDKLGLDPLLETNNGVPVLKDNGGETLTIALLANSPAVNAGNSTITQDARGALRPSGGAVDIGAYERQTDTKAQLFTLEVNPKRPFIGDTIRATVRAIVPDVPGTTISYQWTRVRGRGEVTVLDETGDTLQASAALVKVGDRIILRATIATPSIGSLSRSEGVVIVDTPIKITEFNFRPRTPYAFETLVATVKTEFLVGVKP
ncbi:CSLREA domain-containing protein, partial [bacterium]